MHRVLCSWSLADLRHNAGHDRSRAQTIPRRGRASPRRPRLPDCPWIDHARLDGACRVVQQRAVRTVLGANAQYDSWHAGLVGASGRCRARRPCARIGNRGGAFGSGGARCHGLGRIKARAAPEGNRPKHHGTPTERLMLAEYHTCLTYVLPGMQSAVILP